MFDIQVDRESLLVSSRDPRFLTGDVWLRLDGKAFPSCNWSDSPLSVLGSLRSAILEVRSGLTADMYFFDGPYFAKLAPDGQAGNEQTIKVTGICDRHPPEDSTDGGVAEVEVLADLPEMEGSYSRAVQELYGWATDNCESAVLELLAKMRLV
ncbi:hypothetical protein [Kitasatospora sp. NBC_01302]|uniref:hypothetical protein n=1 Tax=Kitasatospora sp. NBC_01302 TaxID=2903575 RepID=UPI002E11D941|nr:hypothetical protein OG294_36345 [Kitasatospora sp. NBC_01302]